MTLDVYAGLFSDDLDDVADRLDGLVPPVCPEGGAHATGKAVDELLSRAYLRSRVAPGGVEPPTVGLKG